MIILNIEGMSCGHCQKAVKEALEAVNGVERAEVELDPQRATVYGSADANQLDVNQLDANQLDANQLDVNQLIAAVTEEGYSAQLSA